MKVGIFWATVCVVLQVLHIWFFWPVLLRHGSSAAFHAAIVISVMLLAGLYWSCVWAIISSPGKKK